MALQEELEKEGNFLFRYRSYFPLVVLVAGLGVHILSELHNTGNKETLIYEIYEIFCVLVCLLGFSIRVLTVGYSANRTSGRNTKRQVAESVNTTGSYSLVRHPLYLGNFLMWLGIGMFTGNLYFIIIFTLSFWIYYERIMYAEEQFLRRKFDDLYLDWAAKVPPVFPNFKNYVKPAESFHLRKVLRKEKDGFFAFVLIIFIMENVGEWVKEGSFVIDDIWLWVLFIFSLLIYVILKIMKKRKMLDDK
ncbi:MAG: isoprenylcysteine carboxylmethyltransferase family protein [Candidatus Cloacimonetes bacterium]|nr:isoprenylcysteine carboxylmethyltransferase family protein [Candidatus Cloacimonadota bacterium]